MRIRPLRDLVLVKPFPPDDKVGRFYIPDRAKDQRASRATVIDLGPGARRDGGDLIPIEGIKVGDVVQYQDYIGFEIRVDGVEMKLIKAEDIMAVIDSDEPALAKRLADEMRDGTATFPTVS